MDTVTISIMLNVLSLLIAALSITFVILNFGRGKNRDNIQNEARIVSIEKDVQYIRVGVDSLQGRQDAFEKRLDDMESRIPQRKVKKVK